MGVGVGVGIATPVSAARVDRSSQRLGRQRDAGGVPGGVALLDLARDEDLVDAGCGRVGLRLRHEGLHAGGELVGGLHRGDVDDHQEVPAPAAPVGVVRSGHARCRTSCR